MGATASPSPAASPSATAIPGLTSDQQSFLNQYLTSNTAASSSSADAGRVYFGQQQTGSYQVAQPGGMKQMPINSPQWMTLDQAQADFGNWSQKQIQDFTAKGMVAGLLPQGSGQMEAADLWDKLVTQAAIFGAQNKQVSPFDVLQSYITNSGGTTWKKSADGLFETNSLTGERKYIGPQYRTSTTSSVDLTDPATAKATATSVFQQLLGRDPMPGELSAYSSALTQAEQANPTILTQTNQYDDQGNVIATTKQNQKGGYSQDAQDFLAQQQIKAKPEYGAVQAATTYENAFLNAVFGSPK